MLEFDVVRVNIFPADGRILKIVNINPPPPHQFFIFSTIRHIWSCYSSLPLTMVAVRRLLFIISESYCICAYWLDGWHHQSKLWNHYIHIALPHAIDNWTFPLLMVIPKPMSLIIFCCLSYVPTQPQHILQLLIMTWLRWAVMMKNIRWRISIYCDPVLACLQSQASTQRQKQHRTLLLHIGKSDS